VADVLIGWLDRQPLAQVAAWAQAGTAMAPQIVAQFPPWLRRMGWAALAPAAQAAIRAATDADWDQVLARIQAERPALGLLLWFHREWFRRECTALRDAWLADVVDSKQA